MHSSNAAYEPQADPLAPVHQLADWLLGTTTHVLIGLLIGLMAARLMRSRHLHWSWAAAGLTSVVLVGHAFTGSISTPLVATASATAWSRRWHREDLEAGGDLAAIAARRRGPLDALRRRPRGAPASPVDPPRWPADSGRAADSRP